MGEWKFPERALKGKAILFVREYVKDFDSRRAATAAGYAAGSARQRATELLHSPEIQAEVRRLIEKASDKAAVSTERLLNEYAKVAFGDVRKHFKPDGTLVPVTELDDETAAGVAAVDFESATTSTPDDAATTTTRTAKIRRHDKIRALDSLARIRGMFQEHVHVHGADFASKLVRARERARSKP